MCDDFEELLQCAICAACCYACCNMCCKGGVNGGGGLGRNNQQHPYPGVIQQQPPPGYQNYPQQPGPYYIDYNQQQQQNFGGYGGVPPQYPQQHQLNMTKGPVGDPFLAYPQQPVNVPQPQYHPQGPPPPYPYPQQYISSQPSQQFPPISGAEFK